MTEDHAQSAVRKASRRRIPFLVICYTVNFLDRVNVGFAGLAMNEDLGFTPEVFGFGRHLLRRLHPYSIAAVGVVIAGRHSDRTGERILHVALPLFVSGAAFAWSAHAGPLMALSLATLGIYAAVGTFLSLPISI